MDTWQNCYDDSWKNEIAPEAFSHPAKYSRGLIRRIYEHMISEGWLHSGDFIVDPFGGCGTTLVEAKLLNRNAIAVDINPIGILVSKAKTTILIEDQIGKVNKILGLIKEDTKNFYDKKQTKINYVIPLFNNLDHWFDSNVAHELAIAVGYINKISDKDLKNYLERQGFFLQVYLMYYILLLYCIFVT